ncbi:NAD(P)H-hydrate dehydratase [Myxococcota bacterium]|nr:NAD(P)H-hydrate dehydratase [Myxococcota bacterium]MBU1433107.1 NAD(P)H-hydrate dehydratase [Myxococcota bacterium]MBU1900258.1 NAD(P)H-hydrate dehydratase [Myxococcota bacterium]
MRLHLAPWPESHRLLLAEEMRAADAFTIEGLGLPGIALMESAGRAVAEIAREVCPRGGRVGVFCGGGNNGGDGLVAARLLAGWGYDVEILLCAPRAQIKAGSDAAINLQVVERARLTLVEIDGSDAFAQLNAPYDLIIDALLGTGLRGPARGRVAEAIAYINHHPAPVLAVDVPSGLCGDTGVALGDAVRAQHTVTFAASKLGHWLADGPALSGALIIADIGIPPEVIALKGGDRWLLRAADLQPAFAPRPREAHKGDMGHLYVLGGRLGRTGAVRICLDAASAAGVGLLTAGVGVDAFAGLAPQLYEAMAEAAFDPSAPVEPQAAGLAARLNGFDALVIGPGLDARPYMGALLTALMPKLNRPRVIDADGLNHLKGQPRLLRGAVITPHPGEAARLLGCDAAEVQRDRPGAALRLARLTEAVVVLKGAMTLIADPSGALALCPWGNPGMATGGMGDALSGIIGALLARGLEADIAAMAGVAWHALAGDMAAAALTQNGLTARGLIAALRRVEDEIA